MAVPTTPKAFGTPLHAGPASCDATSVPTVLAPTIAVFMAATPANSDTVERRRTSVSATVMGQTLGRFDAVSNGPAQAYRRPHRRYERNVGAMTFRSERPLDKVDWQIV